LVKTLEIDDFFDIDLLDIVPAIALGAVEATSQRVPRNTGQAGDNYLQELLGSNNEKRIYDVLRMKRETFYDLCNWMKAHAGLKPGRKVLVELQVAMLL
jgi:hypothetical protein